MPTRGRDPCSRFLATSLPLWSRVMQRKQRRFASIWALYPNEGCEARNSNHAESRLRCGAQLSQGSAGEGILDENPFVALSVLHLAEDGAASGSTRRPHDQRIPEGQLVKAMQIDRSQDQFSRHLDHVRLRVRRHMLPHQLRRQPESRCRDEGFLQDLRDVLCQGATACAKICAQHVPGTLALPKFR